MNLDDKTQYLITWDKELPEGLALNNCWQFVYQRRKQEITRKVAKKPGVDLLDENKAVLRTLLNEIVAERRKQFEPSSILHLHIRQQKYTEALQVVNSGSCNGGYLEGIAKARNISQGDAAKLVLSKHSLESVVLRTTEAEREKFMFQIDNAEDQGKLIDLRDQILNLRN